MFKFININAHKEHTIPLSCNLMMEHRGCLYYLNRKKLQLQIGPTKFYISGKISKWVGNVINCATCTLVKRSLVNKCWDTIYDKDTIKGLRYKQSWSKIKIMSESKLCWNPFFTPLKHQII